MTLIRSLMFTALVFILACQKTADISEKKSTGAVSSDNSVKNKNSNVASGVTSADSSSDRVPEKKEKSAVESEVKTDWLAKLDKTLNHVEFRQRNESIWKSAELGMYFVRYDALQTQNQSGAKIIYQSGSNLDVKDNTLIIFDHDPGTKKKTEDRVIIKNGELVGSTKTELWVFTNAGLVQIKPGAKSKPAKAKITVAKNDKLNVIVDSGSADVVYKDNEQKFEKIHVAEKSDVEIVSSVKLLDAGTKVSTEKLEEIAAAPEKIIKVTRAELKVDEPIDGEISSETEITAKGHLSALGGKLLINGQLVELNDDLSFAKKILLQSGSNLIVFQLVRSDASVQFMRKTIRLQAGK